MTGTDPAILAAQRAWESEGWGGPGRPLEEGMSEGRLAVAAAREALAPIRAALDNMNAQLADPRRPNYYDDRVELYVEALEEIQKHVYTSEELNQ
ncbi:hypothetical protein [Gordonia sp. SND2]|uniref:hypothetical protein n=1 Tax=Gordonia sp. SND2 TaxID=3388659 RepID=UPI00398AECD9